jgi:hypothetical protein
MYLYRGIIIIERREGKNQKKKGAER